MVTPKAGTQANAQEFGSPDRRTGKTALRYRQPRPVFVHSLTQGVATGVDPGDLALAVIQPGDEPTILTKGVQDLEDRCWFMEWDGITTASRPSRRSTSSSLTRRADRPRQGQGGAGAIASARSGRRALSTRCTFRARRRRWTTTPVTRSSSSSTTTPPRRPPPRTCRRNRPKIFDHSGAMEGYRTYKNNVVFLVADADQVEHMVEVAQRYLAVHRIVGDADRMAECRRTAGQAQRNAGRRRASGAGGDHAGLPVPLLPERGRAEEGRRPGA